MKKLYVFAIALSFFSSCSNEEKVYSCNESINEWVCENLSDIRTMSRTEWSKSDEKLKIPIYRAFTHQQRLDFWLGKFQEVLSLDWSDAEKKHISKLIKELESHPNFVDGYNGLSDQEKNEFDLFFYEWFEISKNEFKWSDRQLYAIVASGNTLLDTKGTLLVSKNKEATLSYAESNCNCSTSSDWCSTSMCEDVSCEDTFLGCGTIFAYDCDGRCGGI